MEGQACWGTGSPALPLTVLALQRWGGHPSLSGPQFPICTMRQLDNTVSMQDVASEPKGQPVSGSFPRSP